MALILRESIEKSLLSLGWRLKETQDGWDIWTDETGSKFEYLPRTTPILFAYYNAMMHRIDPLPRSVATLKPKHRRGCPALDGKPVCTCGEGRFG